MLAVGDTTGSAPAEHGAATRAAARLGGGRGRARIRRLRDYAIVSIFVALFAVLAISTDAFLTKTNLLNLVDQSAALGIIACAGTLVVIAGGFDLSTGAIFALAGVIAAKVTIATDDVAFGYMAGAATGLVAGVANGVALTVGRVNSFVATLASSLIVRGIALAITSGSLVTVENGGFEGLGTNTLAGVKLTTWAFVIACAIFWFVLVKTAYGRYVFAIGGSAEAARLSGVRVGVLRASTFALSGLAAGIAGTMIASRNITGQADSGTGLELTAIAAIVIGGTSIAGGQGAIWRTTLGVLLLGMIGNGFNLLNINPIYQSILTGVIILVAVTVDARARNTVG